MRRHLFAALVLVLLAAMESSLLPSLLGNLPRPSLVLIVSSTWAALRGNEGLMWAAFGGLCLDFVSSAPFGMHLLSLTTGNAIAALVDQIPNPIPLLRATNWTAVATALFFAVSLTILTLVQHPVSIPYALESAVLPAIIINPSLAIPTYLVLSRLEAQLRRQERALP
ncbi:MAG: rod shape-determining protein MreD [Anaerolineae bacterium]|nr:rod shape-determining protein MreD [Thermoflexales bacterium]MDW8395503.1 rod shape-determining protein MreD [Anaerolineae bacterium]